MFLDLHVGNLTEPLIGGRCDQETIMRQLCQRTAYYRSKEWNTAADILSFIEKRRGRDCA